MSFCTINSGLGRVATFSQKGFLKRIAANPVFGPAPRPLPQLPLMIDSAGFLAAQAGYDQPVGPGFWERS